MLTMLVTNKKKRNNNRNIPIPSFHKYISYKYTITYRIVGMIAINLTTYTAETVILFSGT